MAEGGIHMRILLLAILLFVTIHFVRLDLAEGTIPLASFANELPECNDTQKIKTIPVTTVDGDTIETLFALYPVSDSNFMERLTLFYKVNPHLQQQQLIGGQQINLPLASDSSDGCSDSIR